MLHLLQAEQPCSGSSGFGCPRRIIFQHDIHDSQQLSHTRDDGWLGGFCGLVETVGECFDGGIAADHPWHAKHRRHATASSDRHRDTLSACPARTAGRMARAKAHSTAASTRSVFASCPVALATSRAGCGLITATGKPHVANSLASRVSRSPVASIAIIVGARAVKRLPSSAIPVSS